MNNVETVKTVLLYDGASIEPRLHRAFLTAGIPISAIADCADTEIKRARVNDLATCLGCKTSPILNLEASPPLEERSPLDELSTFFDNSLASKDSDQEVPKGIIVSLSEQPPHLKHLDVLTKALSQKNVRVCIPQPCPGFNKLPIEAVINLYATAELHGATLLASTRFNFSTSIYHIKNLIKTSPEFGGLSDILFRTGWGVSTPAGWGVSTPEDDRRHQLMSLAAHAFHVVFGIASTYVEGLPATVTVLEDYQPDLQLKPPVYSISLQWSNGIIATIFLTANRTWGSNYHLIEVSGRGGAHLKADLVNWEIVFQGAEKITPILNDDEQSVNWDGSAPKLRLLFGKPVLDEDSTQALSNEQTVVLESLWLRDTVEWLLNRPRHSNAITLKNYRRSFSSKTAADASPVTLAARRGDFAKAIKIAKDKIAKDKIAKDKIAKEDLERTDRHATPPRDY